jgi:AcrR family transcriptional regulator
VTTNFAVVNVVPTAKTEGKRLSAEQRREQILEASLSEFAIHGLYGTSTETIAERVGISQPYLFRLFKTKKELFLTCVERCFDRTQDTFRAAAESAEPAEVLSAMGQSYVELLRDRELLLAQMQTYAACGDDEIRARVRRRYSELYRTVEQLSGASPDDVRSFFATGMLLNIAAAMDLPELADADGWADRSLRPGD